MTRRGKLSQCSEFAWQMKRELDLVAAARAELLLKEQIEVETCGWCTPTHITDMHGDLKGQRSRL